MTPEENTGSSLIYFLVCLFVFGGIAVALTMSLWHKS